MTVRYMFGYSQVTKIIKIKNPINPSFVEGPWSEHGRGRLESVPRTYRLPLRSLLSTKEGLGWVMEDEYRVTGGERRSVRPSAVTSRTEYRRRFTSVPRRRSLFPPTIKSFLSGSQPIPKPWFSYLQSLFPFLVKSFMVIHGINI